MCQVKLPNGKAVYLNTLLVRRLDYPCSQKTELQLQLNTPNLFLRTKTKRANCFVTAFDIVTEGNSLC